MTAMLRAGSERLRGWWAAIRSRHEADNSAGDVLVHKPASLLDRYPDLFDGSPRANGVRRGAEDPSTLLRSAQDDGSSGGFTQDDDSERGVAQNTGVGIGLGAGDGAKGAARVEVLNVAKRFPGRGGDVIALDAVDLTVDAGEFVSIVGPSGCGKSTLLNIIAGLDHPTSGEIRMDGVPVPDRLGHSAYMHQKDLLLPWRSVLDNATLGLEVAGMSQREARQRAEALLDRFGLRGFETNYPATLSGGMRQRVAFLRTVLTDRPLLLLDEPFGALDALTRATMQEWLLGLWEELRRTIVFITHDVEEAALLSDRVLLMSGRPGRITHAWDVELPRPRHYEMVTDPRLVALKANLLEALRAGEDGSG